MSAVLAITGLPGSGKTTLADALGHVLDIHVFHTDYHIAASWDEQPDLCLKSARCLQSLVRPVVVEGLTVARMFRYGFNPDCLIVLSGGRPHKSLPSLLENGIRSYRGRVIHLPQYPGVAAALRALGTPSRSNQRDAARVQQSGQGHPQ